MKDGLSSVASHSYFAPMVDMLAGVIFILIILLASVTLVSRQDFSADQKATAELKAIQRELRDARLLERDVLQPRRDGQATLERLLSRLHDDLMQHGISATIDPSQGRLEIDASKAFVERGSAVSAIGEILASSAADALAREVPCLAPMVPTRPAECSGYAATSLERIVVGVPEDAAGATLSSARALRFVGAMAGAAPALLDLRSFDGEALIGYRALKADDPPKGIRIVMVFQMDVPPLPRS